MNGKVIVTGVIGLSAIGGCIYLFIRNHKLKNAFDIMEICARCTTEELKRRISEEEKPGKKK